MTPHSAFLSRNPKSSVKYLSNFTGTSFLSSNFWRRISLQVSFWPNFFHHLSFLWLLLYLNIVKVKVSVTQLCLTLCNTMDCSSPRSSLSMEFSRQGYWNGLPFPPSRLRDRTQVSCIACRFFTIWAIRKALIFKCKTCSIHSFILLFFIFFFDFPKTNDGSMIASSYSVLLLLLIFFS